MRSIRPSAACAIAPEIVFFGIFNAVLQAEKLQDQMRVNWPKPTLFEGLSDIVPEGLGPDIRKCAEKCGDSKVGTASPRRSPSIVCL